ncbi:MAG: sugar phosphate isomerase/epimerase [Clostridia bacterium]|nr:sugar phosphate isomerase/epimerase [Clostridia bacterium]
MKIISTTAVFPPCWDPLDIMKRLFKSGHDGLDMAFDYCTRDKDFPFMTDAFESWADTLRNEAEKLGMSCTHSHAPFDVTCRSWLVERSFRCAEILGVRYMVVHPVWQNEQGIITDDETFIRTNKEAVLPILECAEKHGVTVLSENLLWGASIRSQTLSALVEEVRSSGFGWCYDAGHAHAMGDSLENFRKVSCPPLSLHVQDNHGNGRDEHLIPGNGTLDWLDFMRSLKAVGYAGEFVLEAHHQPLEAPDEERDTLLADIAARSRKLIAYYEGLV